MSQCYHNGDISTALLKRRLGVPVAADRIRESGARRSRRLSLAPVKKRLLQRLEAGFKFRERF